MLFRVNRITKETYVTQFNDGWNKVNYSNDTQNKKGEYNNLLEDFEYQYNK